ARDRPGRQGGDDARRGGAGDGSARNGRTGYAQHREATMNESLRSFDGLAGSRAAERVSAFLRAVYGWMTVGLAVTALMAFFVASSPALAGIFVANRLVFFALVIA